jgi:hypothetical protein
LAREDDVATAVLMPVAPSTEPVFSAVRIKS